MAFDYTSVLCFNCEKKPVDLKPRLYKNVAEGKVYACNRLFCCDDCESAYTAKMTVKYPKDSANLIRL